MKAGVTASAAVTALALIGPTQPLAAQDARLGPATAEAIADRVAGVREGTVRMAFEVKPGVQICDRGIHTGGDGWSRRSGDRYDVGRCITDVAQVDVVVRGGVVRDVDLVRPSGDPPDDLRADLGLVPPEAAAGFLLGLASNGATDDAAEDAIFPATIADTDGLWRDLLDLARDRSLDRDVRKSALFWVGQEAAEAATEGLSDVALADGEEQEVREAAIFALSQRPENQAVASLIEIARSAEQAESRRAAMFWLAQSEDDRVVEFFEAVLLGRNR